MLKYEFKKSELFEAKHNLNIGRYTLEQYKKELERIEKKYK